MLKNAFEIFLLFLAAFPDNILKTIFPDLKNTKEIELESHTNGIITPYEEEYKNAHMTNQVCAVCLNDEVKCDFLTRCNHSFHQECVAQWMPKNSACPLCRHAISGNIEVETMCRKFEEKRTNNNRNKTHDLCNVVSLESLVQFLYLECIIRGNPNFEAVLDRLVELGWNSVDETKIVLPVSVEIICPGSQNQVSLLHLACLYNRVDIVKRFIQLDAHVNTVDQDGNSPLLLAVTNGGLELVDLLIRAGADIEFKNIDGNSPLILSCITGHVDIFDRLTKAFADINTKGFKNRTALHFACLKGHTAIAFKLIDLGAVVNDMDTDGSSPLHYACYNTFFEYMHRKEGGTLRPEEEAKLESVKFQGRYGLAKKLIESGADVNLAEYVNKHTVLHLVSKYGQLNMVQLFLSHQADVNALSNINRSPLHFASYFGHFEVVQLLLEAGAEVNAADNFMQTAIHFACMGSHMKIAETLVQAGANLDATDIDGMTALSFACQEGNNPNPINK